MMKILNLVVSRRVMRGTVNVEGARYYAPALEARHGEALAVIVRGDGSAFADLGSRPLELERIA